MIVFMCLKEKEIPRAEIPKKIKGKHKNLAHFQQIPIGINTVWLKPSPSSSSCQENVDGFNHTGINMIKINNFETTPKKFWWWINHFYQHSNLINPYWSKTSCKKLKNISRVEIIRLFLVINGNYPVLLRYELSYRLDITLRIW